MNNLIALLLTFVVGIFILIGTLIGTLIVFISKNNKKFVSFSISIAFGVMISLVIFELIPEGMELLDNKLILVLSILFGILLLKLLDLFIPDHEHEHHEDKTENKEEHLNNLFHIGFISSLALIIHNFIEGIAIYSAIITSINVGLLVCLGVGLHNIPMGMVITSTIYTSNKNKKKTLIFSFLISISTFLGGLSMFLFSSLINDFILGILLGLTTGMIIYIVLFELLKQLIESKYKLLNIIGFIVGVLILMVSLILG